MNRLGFSLSEELDANLEESESSSKSRGKAFNYFQYPVKEKQKPFSQQQQSCLDDTDPTNFAYVADEFPNQNQKYDQIIETQEKVIELLKTENNNLMDKSRLADIQLSYLMEGLFYICSMLNVQMGQDFSFTLLHHRIDNLISELSRAQTHVIQSEKKIAEHRDLKQRANSNVYQEKPSNTRSRKPHLQYREKEDIPRTQKLQKQIECLRDQISKLQSNSAPVPLFVPSVKEKKIEVVIQKIVQRVVEKVVEKVVERIVQKPVVVERTVYIEKPTIVQKILERPVYFEKKVKEEVLIYVDKVVEKTIPVYIDRDIHVDRIVYIREPDKTQLVSTSVQTQ